MTTVDQNETRMNTKILIKEYQQQTKPRHTIHESYKRTFYLFLQVIFMNSWREIAWCCTLKFKLEAPFKSIFIIIVIQEV